MARLKRPSIDIPADRMPGGGASVSYEVGADPGAAELRSGDPARWLIGPHPDEDAARREYALPDPLDQEAYQRFGDDMVHEF